jgi:hypothetical protein
VTAATVARFAGFNIDEYRVNGHFDAMSVFGNLVAEEIEYGAVFPRVQEAQ